MHRAVLAEAKEVAAKAREKADWSTRIPATIKASAQGVNTAVVKAGGANAPHAAAYEMAGKSGMFRHPVHADPSKSRDEWTWVSEQSRPFLHPSALERLDKTVEALGTAVSTAVSDVIGRP